LIYKGGLNDIRSSNDSGKPSIHCVVQRKNSERGIEKMKKSELKTGMIVEFRAFKTRYMLVGNIFICRYMLVGNIFICESGFMDLDDIKDDLTNNEKDTDWDIVKIYTSNSWGLGFVSGLKYAKLLWERKEPKMVTITITECQLQKIKTAGIIK